MGGGVLIRLREQFSNWTLHQNHLKGLFRIRSLGPNPEFLIQSVGWGLRLRLGQVAGGADAAGLGATFGGALLSQPAHSLLFWVRGGYTMLTAPTDRREDRQTLWLGTGWRVSFTQSRGR